MKRVLFESGLNLGPHHLQTQTRYGELTAHKRALAGVSYAWGLSEFEIDHDLLKVGKLQFNRIAGVFQDGTPFEYPDEGVLLDAVNLDESWVGQDICICIAPYRAGRMVGAHEDDRYENLSISVSDETAVRADPRELSITALRIGVRHSGEDLNDKLVIPVTRVVSAVVGHTVELERQYIAPFLDVKGSSLLSNFLQEARGLVQQSVDRLRDGFVAPASLSPGEVSNFVKYAGSSRHLQTLRHFESLDKLHPERLYQTLIEIVGEMVCFEPTKSGIQLAPYNHTNCTNAFLEVMGHVRDLMGGPVSWSCQKLNLVKDNLVSRAAIPNLPGSTEVRGFLGLSPRSTDDVRTEEILLGKGSEIDALRIAAITNITLQREVSRPLHIQDSRATLWYRLDPSEDYWRAVLAEGEIGLVANDALSPELWLVRV